jgi:DNA-nicking Smr family endonuclease
VARRRRKRGGKGSPELTFTGDLLDATTAATLDLHGDTGPEAERRVRDFILTHSRISRGKVVHIVTGRGRGSTKGPVLPGVVRRVLEKELDRFVEEFDRDLDESGFLVRLR